MKYLALALTLFVFTPATYAGTPIDTDRDSFVRILEDNGLAPIEDDQDRCNGIPNVSLTDDHCSVDLSGDNKFTVLDLMINLSRNDHRLDTPYAGDTCFFYKRVITYNFRLAMAGKPPLQLDEPFIVTTIPVHCFGDHDPLPPVQ